MNISYPAGREVREAPASGHAGNGGL